MRRHPQDSSPEIDVDGIRHLQGRPDHLRPGEFRSDVPRARFEIERRPRGEGSAEAAMPDELDRRTGEGPVPQQVIGVHVRVDHMAHGKVRNLLQRGAQLQPERKAAAAVDERHGFPSDYDRQVPDGAQVAVAGVVVRTRVDVDALRHRLQLDGFRRTRGGRPQSRTSGRQPERSGQCPRPERRPQPGRARHRPCNSLRHVPDLRFPRQNMQWRRFMPRLPRRPSRCGTPVGPAADGRHRAPSKKQKARRHPHVCRRTWPRQSGPPHGRLSP